MKKIIVVLAAFMLSSYVVNAQTFVVKNDAGMLMKAPSSEQTNENTAKLRKIELADNQLLMGPYMTDEVASNDQGLGLASFPGTLSAASIIPIEAVKPFDSGKVIKMRVGLANKSNVTRIFILPINEEGNILNDEPILSQEVKFNNTGWNEVEIASPTTLDFSNMLGIVMGFDYKQGSNQQSYESYPLSMVSVGEPYDVYIYGNLGQGTGWYNLGNGYGNLSVQAVVESENFPEKSIVIDGFTLPAYVKKGDAIPYQVKLHNFGTKDINKFALNFTIDKQLAISVNYTQTLTTDPIVVSGELPARLITGISKGVHEMGAWVYSFDDLMPEKDVHVETNFISYGEEDVMDHNKYLIEELTSHSCTYCPYGANIVNAIHENNSDVAIACIHGNQSRQDPWNTKECEALNTLLGLSSWPSGTLNRIYDHENGDLTRGFGYYPEYAQQIAKMFYEIMVEESVPTFATVDIMAEKNDDVLEIVVSGNGAEKAKDFLSNASLTIYITEDSIVGQQLNLGKWVSNYVHNHVLRDVVTDVVGDDICWLDNSRYENKYTVKLNNDWNIDRIKVIAFISQKPTSATNPDRKNMAVFNANDAIISLPDGIRSVDTSDRQKAKIIYNIAGQRVEKAEKGVYIVNGKKVLVK